MSRAQLTGVGVGPGDPKLVTVAGVEALRSADVVFVPVAADAPAAGLGAAGRGADGAGDLAADPGAGDPAAAPEGYAERVVRFHLGGGDAGAPGAPVQRLAFSVGDDPTARARSWQAAADAVAEAIGPGRHAAFATIGDPNLYATFGYLAAAVRERLPDLAVRTVPGITAAQDLAARSGTVLAEGDETLALLPLTAGADAFADALARFDTVIAYKGGRRLPELRAVLAQAGRLDDAVFGARLGLDGEEIRAGGALPDAPAPYLSTVLVTPPARRRTGRHTAASEEGAHG